MEFQAQLESESFDISCVPSTTATGIVLARFLHRDSPFSLARKLLPAYQISKLESLTFYDLPGIPALIVAH